MHIRLYSLVSSGWLQGKSYLILIVLVFVFQGCVMFAPEDRNPEPEVLPPKYSLYSENGETFPEKWWETFDSPELNRLVETAFTGNFSIREAWARLEQARAVSARANAGLWPEVTGSATASRYEMKSTDSSGNVTKTDTNAFSLGLAASYELDLWGRLRSKKTAEGLKMQAGRADLEASAMTVAAGMAENWIDLIAIRKELQMVTGQVAINTTMLKLQELRFEKSLATALDVLQQMEVVERSKARIPPLEAEESVLLHSLSLLMGRPPGTDPGILQQTLPVLDPVPATGIPADLLAMRPDVRAAGLRLKAADWEIAAAKANRLPALTLTGSAAYSGDAMDTLFDNWIRNLAAGLTGPVFDAGGRRADVQRAKAVVQERLAGYENTVFTALKEVEDSLIREQKQIVHIRALEKQLQAAGSALGEARIRYIKGLGDFLPFLLEQISEQELQRELIRQRATLFKYRISLYRALGGSWTRVLTPEGVNKNDLM